MPGPVHRVAGKIISAALAPLVFSTGCASTSRQSEVQATKAAVLATASEPIPPQGTDASAEAESADAIPKVPPVSQQTQDNSEHLQWTPGIVETSDSKVTLKDGTQVQLPVGWEKIPIEDGSTWFIAAPSYEREPREGIFFSVAHTSEENNLERSGWILSDVYNHIVGERTTEFSVVEPRTTHIGLHGLHGRDLVHIKTFARLSDRFEDKFNVYWGLFAPEQSKIAIGVFDVVDPSPAIQKIFEELVNTHREMLLANP